MFAFSTIYIFQNRGKKSEIVRIKRESLATNSLCAQIILECKHFFSDLNFFPEVDQ